MHACVCDLSFYKLITLALRYRCLFIHAFWNIYLILGYNRVKIWKNWSESKSINLWDLESTHNIIWSSASPDCFTASRSVQAPKDLYQPYVVSFSHTPSSCAVNIHILHEAFVTALIASPAVCAGKVSPRSYQGTTWAFQKAACPAESTTTGSPDCKLCPWCISLWPR
jgi:hypothetical protein